ncbi:MAG TPA: hypothetical protein VH640_04170 [Bryobacteraceae bacterium]|jgi:hypothetical protein
MASGFAELSGWANYYVIVGSSAGALTGLQFVVITLLAQVGVVGSGQELRAFGTPNVVHFCAALLISAMMSAPWNAPSPLGICLAALGAIGFAYSLLVWRHAKRATGYKPDIGDWISYITLPLATYAALAVGGVLVARHVRWSLVVIAAVALLFLFIGIRNAWDTITYVALARHGRKQEPGG